MVQILAAPDTDTITIAGHGIAFNEPFQLNDSICLRPVPLCPDLDVAAASCPQFEDYAAVVTGRGIATFGVEVKSSEGGRDAAVKGWNALWIFHLLSIAAGAPCYPLYAVSSGQKPTVTLANRSPFIRPLKEVLAIDSERLCWARQHQQSFDELIKSPQFSAAMLCFGNAHYMPDLQVRIMLLWAGIEGLLAVDSELSRRLALYAALMLDGTPDEKAKHFAHVKKAYQLRSRAVHGARLSDAKLQEGYADASHILVGLLARCVELQRVPSPEDLDRIAVAGSLG